VHQFPCVQKNSFCKDTVVTRFIVCLSVTQPTDMDLLFGAFYSRYSKLIFLNSRDLISLSLVSPPCFFFIVHNASEISSHEVLLTFRYSLVYVIQVFIHIIRYYSV